MNPKLWLLGRAAVVGARVAGEKLRPVSAELVPVHPRAATCGWYSAVLCRDVPGAEVVSVDCVGGSDGTSTRTAVRVAYNEKGHATGLPTDLFRMHITLKQMEGLVVNLGRSPSAGPRTSRKCRRRRSATPSWPGSPRRSTTLIALRQWVFEIDAGRP